MGIYYVSFHFISNLIYLIRLQPQAQFDFVSDWNSIEKLKCEFILFKEIFFALKFNSKRVFGIQLKANFFYHVEKQDQNLSKTKACCA